MTSIANYILSAYSSILKLPLDNVLEVGDRTKNGSPIPSFDEKLLIDLCLEVQKIFEKEDNVLELEGDFIIVGDIHGSFHDLLRIIKYLEENNSRVLFLGDYVDRGEFSLECITILFAMKILQPDTFFLIRGNHEFDSLCSQYGFKKEILNFHNPKKIKPSMQQKDQKIKITSILAFNFEEEEEEEPEKKGDEENKCDEYYENRSDMNCYKYSEKLYEAFIQAFSYLPLSAILNNSTFCIHGGLSPLLEKVDLIRTLITRPIRNFEDNKLLSDLIWSDPSSHTNMFSENHRGRGCLFNFHVVFNFLKKNSLNRVIRAHECVKNGVHENFHDKCITVFSASSYSQDMGNSSAILKLTQQNDQLEYLIFSPLHRLSKTDALYFKVQAFEPKEKNKPVLFSMRHPQLVFKGNTSSPSGISFPSLKGKNHKQIKINQSQYQYMKQKCLVKPNLLTQRKSLVNIKSVPQSISLNRFNPRDSNICIIPFPTIDESSAENEGENEEGNENIAKGSINKNRFMNRSGSIPDLLYHQDSNLD